MTDKDTKELIECLELLDAIETIEYHNRNWLPAFAIKSPGKLSEEKRSLIKRALTVSGTSAKKTQT